MPVNPTYPGVYIEEIPSGVHTIVGVSTSTTAFVGRARKGPVNAATTIHSFGEFDRIFGGLWDDSTMSFTVQQYFLNGGSEAVIVRVTRGNTATAATFTLGGPSGNLVLQASSPGAWGSNLALTVDHDTAPPPDPLDPTTFLFNLVVSDPPPNGTGDIETLRNLSPDPASPRFVTKILEQQSKFVRVTGSVPDQRPHAAAPTTTTSGSDGNAIQDTDLVPGSPVPKNGIYALDGVDIFNLLCLSPPAEGDDVDAATYATAAAYCADRRAMLIVDPPGAWGDPAAAQAGLSALSGPFGDDKKNAALYFPRVRMANPLKNNLIQDFVPCGAIAGVYARTDGERGVWKAPAGQEAGLSGVLELTYKTTDGENGDLNPLGLNCLRTFPLIGPVVWGARTLDGADALASEWKYVPIRRLALYIEESLFRGTKWVVFEPNDEPLWAQIRLNVGAFMHQLFRQGAFQGLSPKEAYFVKCDAETTTQADRDLGIVNIVVGFAPLKPAEFVIIKIQQIAGQLQT